MLVYMCIYTGQVSRVWYIMACSITVNTLKNTHFQHLDQFIGPNGIGYYRTLNAVIRVRISAGLPFLLLQS